VLQSNLGNVISRQRLSQAHRNFIGFAGFKQL
jgi:hypothetical protein